MVSFDKANYKGEGMFERLSIKAKLILVIFVLLFISITASTVSSVIAINKITEENIQKYQEEAFNSKKEELKHLVSVAVKSLESFYKRSTKFYVQKEVEKTLTAHMNQLFSVLNAKYNKYKDIVDEETLPKKLIEIVKNSIYGKRGYFWIND